MEIIPPVINLYRRICATKYGLLFMVVIAACVINGFFYGLMDATSVITNATGIEGGFHYGKFSIATTAMLIFSGFFSILFSYFAMKYSCYRVMRFGLILEILGIIGFCFIANAPSIVPMLLFGIVWGAAGGALSYGIVVTAAEKHIKHKYVPFLSAAIFTSHSLISIVLTPVLSLMLLSIDIVPSFLILAFVVFCTLPLVEILKEKENVPKKRKPWVDERRFLRIVRNIITDVYFWISIGIFFALGFILAQAINDAETVYAFDDVEFMGPLLIGVLNLILIIGSVFLTKRLQKITNKYVVLAIVFLGIAPIGIISPAVPYDIILPVEILFVAALLFFAFPLALTILTEKYNEVSTPVVFSLILISYYLGQCADSIFDAYGKFFAAGFDSHIIIGAAAIVVCSIILFLYNKWLGAKEKKGVK